MYSSKRIKDNYKIRIKKHKVILDKFGSKIKKINIINSMNKKKLCCVRLYSGHSFAINIYTSKILHDSIVDTLYFIFSSLFLRFVRQFLSKSLRYFTLNKKKSY